MVLMVEPLFDITEVAVIGDHCLRLSFEDGTVGDVDFSAKEWPGVLAPLRDAAYFAQISGPRVGDDLLARWPGPCSGATLRGSAAKPGNGGRRHLVGEASAPPTRRRARTRTVLTRRCEGDKVGWLRGLQPP